MIPRRLRLLSFLLAAALRAVAQPAAAPAAKAPLVPTEIESGSAEMVSTDKETTFTFGQGVTVTATNLKLTCRDLVVLAVRSGDPSATIGKQEQFKSMVATGSVRIVQNDREATCDRAEVFPGENKVILTGNPRVRSLDGQYQATGPAMELLRGERRARIIGNATERPRITLPALKDLGYEKEKPKAAPAQAAKPEAPVPAVTVPLPGSPK